MNSAEQDIIMKYATDEISEMELCQKLPGYCGDKNLVCHYKKAIDEKDGEALQFLSMLPKKDYYSFVDVNKELILECWHQQHEELARFFQFFVKDVSCVDTIVEAMYLKCDYWVDEGDAFIRKCAYVLGTLQTDYAILKLRELSKSNNEIIKKYSSYQLEKLGL